MRKLLVVAFVLLTGMLASAQTVQHGITLSWSWTGTGTVTYSVYRATTPGAEAKPPLATGVALTYTDQTVAVGTKYCYTITATVGGVESAASTEVCAQVVVPNTPTNPSATIF